ncbi:MAG: hypothetical protein ABI828_07880 [Actinomycetota bacterium]
MKRTLTALLAGIVVFATVYGFAASLSVSASSLGAGTSAVAACQSATLTASYAVAYDSSIPAYKVGVVTVSGLDTGAGKCPSKAFKVTLTGPGASNASLGEVTGTTPSSGTTFTADFTSSNVSAASITNIHVVISG